MSEITLLTSSGDVDDAKVQGIFVTEALKRFSAAMHAGYLAQALMWLNQAGSISDLTDEQMTAVKQAYAGHILESINEIESTALNCGNILPLHDEHAQMMSECAEQLVALNKRQGKEIPAAMAIVAQGFIKQLQDVTVKFIRLEYRYTKVSDLEEMFALTDNIRQNIARLTREADALALSPQARIAISGVAISNARYGLSMLFPRFLSEWDKSIWFCAQAKRLLSTLEPSALPYRNELVGGAALSTVQNLLTQADASLKERRYFRSTRLLKTAEDLLAQ